MDNSDFEKFKLAAEFAPTHIIFTDIDGVILYANPAAEKITGYTKSEMIGKRPSLWGGHMPKSYYERMWKTIKIDKQVFHSELKNKRKNGEFYEAEVWISPALNQKNELTGFVGVEVDISDKIKMIKDLKRNRRSLREITGNIEEASFLMDLNGKLLYMSPAYEKIFGRPISEINKLTQDEWLELSVSKKDRARIKLILKQGLLKNTGPIECRIIRPDGEKRWVEARAFPVFDDKGEICRIAGVVTDITEKKRVEAKSKDMDALKNKFIEIASHQFRTPMTAIRWNLEMAFNKELGPMNEAQIGVAKATHAMSLEIIKRLNNLLTALDIENQRINFSKQTTSIESLVSGVITEKLKLCEQKNIICKFVPPEEPCPPVIVDPIKIRDVIDQFVDNSITYTNIGSVIARVYTLVDKVRIEVSDTGIGIPDLEQKRIFSRFYRASNAAVMKPDGSGLGLYIAKYFIEQHDGNIGFESKEGQGSTFWFEIPLSDNLQGYLE